MATHDFGGTLSYSSNGSSYTAVARVRKITQDEHTTKDIELPYLAMTNGIMEMIPGNKKIGKLNFEVEFAKAFHATMFAAWQAGTVYYWKITNRDGDQWIERGYLSSFQEPDHGNDDAQLTRIKITPSAADLAFTAS